MDNSKRFQDIFESFEDYRKVVSLINLIQNEKNLLKEIGFSKNDIDRLSLVFKKILIDQHEQYLNYVKNEEESIIEKFLNK